MGIKWQFSTNISLHLRKCTREGHNSYITLIGSYVCDWYWVWHWIAGAREAMPHPDIECGQQVTVLGVVINDRMSASDHVIYFITSCARLLYALRVLRVHGLPQQSLNDVYWATIQRKFLYASPALSKPAKQVWYWALRVYWEPHWPDSVCMYVCMYVIKLLPNHWTDLHKNYTSKWSILRWLL